MARTAGAVRMRMLIDELSPDDLLRLLALTREFKGRFAAVARQYLNEAEARGIDEETAQWAVANECLLLATYMYTGDRQTFMECANAALEIAEQQRPKRGAVQ